MSPLTGRVAVVTGAARGIGAAVARGLAARGVRVALVGLEPDELAGVAHDCGTDSAWWEADVTDGTRLLEVAGEIADRFGPADILVSNAGIAAGGPVLLADPASFDRVIEVNLVGSVRTARAFLPQLVERRGYLLQIASLAALAAAPGMAAYCASKSGVEAFAHSLSIELAQHRVGVGVAYLSWTDTDLTRGADAVARLGQERGRLPYPLRRTYPLEPAAERLVDGIERRSAHIYAPSWVRAVVPVRGFLPMVLSAAGRRSGLVPDDGLGAAGVAATLPLGPGGAADTRARGG